MQNYHILKVYCKGIFMIGRGNFWYEKNEIGDDQSFLYRAFGCISFFIFGFMTIMEIMAAVMSDLPEDEKRDSVSLAVSHTIVMLKIVSVLANKSLIKSLGHKIINVCQSYEEKHLMAEKYKIMKMNVIAYFVIVYGSYACYIFEGLRKVYAGSHFITVVTYYPSFEDDSLLATFIRIFNTIVLFVIILTMIVSVDCFTIVYIIMYKYKFITLRHYIEHLKKEVEQLYNEHKYNMASENLANGLIEGIVMHNNVLKLSKDIDKAFGIVIALQLCQSSGSAVSILLQIALSDDLNFVSAGKLIFFVVALFFLLGLFLCNAGEISIQATLLSDTIFYCGWHLCKTTLVNMPRRNIRQLVLLAMVQAQRPLVMKAFKMLELTYATFLLVLRSTYSVFALFYARNK